MNHTNRTSQSGFSLVELMVVVAIIGILASIAIPSVSKYMAKARQSEAKVNLGSLYMAEKAFFTEYNTYDTRFGVVGYNPEGQIRYTLGFGTGTNLTATPSPAGIGTATNTNTYCSSASQTACSVAPGVSLPATTSLSTYGHNGNATTNASTFTAGAAGAIGGTQSDVWQMTHLKVLTNTTNGI